MKYMQPRPSSIVAALYTARDLAVDVAILHGPSGCSFKHARLLEEDGMRVLTTSLADHEFIFGGQKPLETVLCYAEETFSPHRMAVIGTCVSMIIGEDLGAAVEASGIETPVIAVDIHAGFPENIDGVIATLVPAADAGWITEEELDRQKFLLAKGKRGRETPRCGEQALYRTRAGRPQAYRRRAAPRTRTGAGRRGMAIMNAKKETAYMFADILIALHDTCPSADILYLANLEDRGLPKGQGRCGTDQGRDGMPAGCRSACSVRSTSTGRSAMRSVRRSGGSNLTSP